MPTHLRTMLIGAALAVSTAACASSSSPAANATTTRARTARADANLVTATELAATSEVNLYDFVSQHRPRWLQPRSSGGRIASRGAPQTSGGVNVAVYQDLTRLGGVDMLRSMSREGVKSLRFYDVAEAQQRFPNRETGAVIQVITR